MNKPKLKILSITLAVILIAVISQGTLAYYKTIGTATNVVTSGNIRFEIQEKTAGGLDFPREGISVIPGDKVEKRVTIQNICDQPFYLRVKLIGGIDTDEIPGDEWFGLDIDTDNWYEHTDGWIYYKGILQPEEITPEVFTTVEILGEKVDNDYIGKTLKLTVAAQAVQSKHNAVSDPWDAVGWPQE